MEPMVRVRASNHAGAPSDSAARRALPLRPLSRVGRLTATAGLAVALILALAGLALAGGFASSGSPAGAAGTASHAAGTAAAAPAARPVSGATGPGGRAAGHRTGSRRPVTRASPAWHHLVQAPHRPPQPPRADIAQATDPREGRALRTSCRSAAHIGDSTSADLISPDYLPDPAQRLAARYADVGVRSARIDASGGRSIVEVLPGQVNGYNVARAWWDEGYRGCWVFALGTNDTANVAVGSGVGLMARIERMMSAAHGEPVMWVNTRTLLPSGPWAQANEQSWDATLVQALAMYPNMRILNWGAVAKPGWFLSDGIHYTSAGCAVRAEAIADGLARAFPEHGRSRGQIVR